jgi:hypothetical protein
MRLRMKIDEVKKLHKQTMKLLPSLFLYSKCKHNFKVELFSDLEDFIEIMEDGAEYKSNNVRIARHIKCEKCGLFKVDRIESNPFAGLNRKNTKTRQLG